MEKRNAWVFLNEKRNKVNGYAICVTNNNYKDDIKRAFLIDLISVDKDTDTLKSLIGACIKEAKKKRL